MILVSVEGKYFQVDLSDALEARKGDISFFRFQINLIASFFDKLIAKETMYPLQLCLKLL